MFGIGKGDEEDLEPAVGMTEEAATDPVIAAADAILKDDQKPDGFRPILFDPSRREPADPRHQTTILAEGSVFEGTLRTKGSVDLACEFKGSIFAEGDVVMRTSMEGNVEGDCVELVSCTVKGDVAAKSKVTVHQGSSIGGNIKAKDVDCGGRVDGDITATGHVVLEGSARLTGDLSAAALTVEEGAAIEGSLKVVKNRD